jgi:hypothetical protein
MAFTPLQYRSHMLRNLGWPPMSHNWNTIKISSQEQNNFNVKNTFCHINCSRQLTFPPDGHACLPHEWCCAQQVLQVAVSRIKYMYIVLHVFECYSTSSDLNKVQHMTKKFAWSNDSHTLIVTFPLVIFRMLKPTVGIISSLNCPDWKRQ